MATWNVVGGDRTVSVDSGSWLGALGQGLPLLGLSAGSLARLVCAVRADGSADVHDPVTGIRVRVEPAVVGTAPELEMPVSSFLGTLGGMPDEGTEETEEEQRSPLRGLDPGEVAAGEIVDRMEMLFDRCGDIAAAQDHAAACEIALRLLAQLVPTDATAVLVHTRDGARLRFAAATGPTARRVLGTVISSEAGIAGFAYGFGIGVIVEDVRADARHFGGVDRATGYRTRAILAVPIRAPEGASLGCVELLNPPSSFVAEDIDIAQTVASALGARLA